jgi:GT2 family glycosyltransferase
VTIREIGVVLVSWEDAADLFAAVRSLAAARQRAAPGTPLVSLVVVDNGGRLPGDELLSAWPDARLLVNPINRGYAPAANQGAAQASGDVLLFLNPDTRAEGEPFGALVDAFESDASIVAVAPRLIEMDGPEAPGITSRRLAPPGREDQFTFQLRRLPRLSDDARELLLIDHLWPNNPRRRRFRYAGRDPESVLAVEQPAGAALAVRRSVFESVGGFDEGYLPAYYEDVDLCARLLGRGKILYCPAARFRHRGGVASSRLGYARFLPLFYRNALRYRRRHYGAGARAVYRLLLATGMLLRLAALPFRARLTRPRGEAARAYLSAFAIALGFGRRP